MQIKLFKTEQFNYIPFYYKMQAAIKNLPSRQNLALSNEEQKNFYTHTMVIGKDLNHF